ncbi:MAG: DUF3822 family protein [Tannerella sp.]|jgi:hypothetical protein|nr:DUF3822 family protein [Tannerella sp.]
MIIRVPDTLNVDNSEKYNASIRLWPGGLSFSGYIPSEADSFFAETVLLDRNIPLVQSLKEIFFDNESLSYVYDSLHVICVTEKYTLAPDSVFSEKDKDLLFSFCFRTDRNRRVLFQPLKPIGSSLLFGIDSEVYEFMIRSLINPQFIHSLSPLLLLWRKTSLACYPKQIYAVVHDAVLDIVCFERGEILFINSFCHETENDIIYFIMYVCKQLSVNQFEDYIYICGDKHLCRKIMPVIKNYMAQVGFLSPKMEKYRTSLDQDVYMDVKTLMECGL